MHIDITNAVLVVSYCSIAYTYICSYIVIYQYNFYLGQPNWQYFYYCYYCYSISINNSITNN